VFRNWFEGLAVASFDLNQDNIKSLVRGRSHSTLCDLGCDDGTWTMALAAAAGATELHGVEIVHERAKLARDRGIKVVVADLNRNLPYAADSFDLVHANQVIEHITDLDKFLSEIHRVLRPGGVSVISTENASSWHNIGASVMGWQIFSLSNVSSKVGGLGNPLALHRGESGMISSWTHKTVFNYRGLLEIQQVHGLRPTKVLGAGYHPLSPRLGRVDPRHAHLLAVLSTKE
jgi:ubiquinone/menaquinone biosynthesis C-methylase UbiE